MLRLTVSTEEYLMIGDDIRIVFLGGSRNHIRIMVDAPRNVDIVRSTVVENKIEDPEIKAKLPTYYPEPELPERFRKQKQADTTRPGGRSPVKEPARGKMANK